MATNNAADNDTQDQGGRLSRNPSGALIGGFAVGAVLGFVIPASQRERSAIQPLASKLTDAARSAAREAAEKGRDKLNQATGAAVTQVGAKLIDAVAPAENG